MCLPLSVATTGSRDRKLKLHRKNDSQNKIKMKL